ncbi:MAG: hypothetical protein E7578_03840 [Ruminococcaceae bacterium]|nr:hypothetical protein [Oscillospiraceae bacterium]
MKLNKIVAAALSITLIFTSMIIVKNKNAGTTAHAEWDAYTGEVTGTQTDLTPAPEPEGGYSYAVSSEGYATITSADATVVGDVVIPDTLGGYTVISIFEYAFGDCDSITSVTIPDSVTGIGYGAFSSCELLESVVIGNGIEYIAAYAFAENENLTSITLPDKGINIDWRAFYLCGYYNNSANWEDGALYIGNHLIEVSPDTSDAFAVKNGCVNIAGYAFDSCISITDISIPDTVVSIGTYAFCDCSGITEIDIPDSVTKIYENAFAYCNNLVTLTLSNSITEIAHCLFYGCTNLEDIVIPNTVTTIGNDVFVDCISLVSITIPDSVTKIGFETFYGCLNLESVTFGRGVTAITDRMFFRCESLKEINMPDNVKSIGVSAFYYCISLTEITIGNGVKSIDEGAFEGCESLSTVNISDSVATIGYGAFNDCSNITTVNMGTGIKEICEYAFSGTAITNITLPEGLDHIGSYAFYMCSSLTEITIPDSVTKIDYCAFNCCTSLTDVTLEHGLTGIDEYTFYSCISLESIYISGTIKTICNGAFEGCTSLQSVFIPGGVSTIGEDVFAECPNISLSGREASAAQAYAAEYNIPFTVIENNCTHENTTLIHEREVTNVIDGYTGDTFCIDCDEYTEYGEQVYATGYDRDIFSIDDTGVIIEYYGDGGDIVIPDGVIGLTDLLFIETENITSITIPDSVTSIGYSQFANNNFIMYCSIGSYAATYAHESGIDVFYTDTITNVSIETMPSRTTYPVNGTLNLRGLKLRVLYDNNVQLVVTKGYTIGEYDFSEEGTKTITVNYGSHSVQFEVYVDPDLILYPESAHPYDNSSDESWSYTHSTDATSLKITFSGTTYTESGYDFIYIYDKDGNIIGEYSGNELSGATIIVPGNSFTITLISDDSINDYGFEITNIEALNITNVVLETQPLKLTYALNGTLDLSGLSLKVMYGDGSENIVTNGYTVSEYDFSEEGTKTITVTYYGYSFEFDVYVDPTILDYPESSHPYTDNCDMTWSYTHYTDSDFLTITFSADTYTESNYDFIYVYDGNDNEIGKYSGNDLSDRTIAIPGNSFSIKLTSDASNVGYGFAIAEISSMNISGLSIATQPDKLTYPLNSTLDLEGLSLNVVFDNGSTEIVTSDFTVGEYDFSTAGTKTITLSYGKYSVQFEVLVDADLLPYPESEHPYGNSSNESWTYTHGTEVDYLDITFSYNTYTESGYDYIYIYDGNDNRIGEYSGYYLSDETIRVYGNVFTIELISDSSNTEYGFKITQILGYYTENHPGFTISDKGVLIKYTGNDEDVIIPDTVTGIGEKAFEDHTEITSVTIHKDVTAIDSSAFYGCENITICCYAGSVAEQYAIDNEMTYKIIDEEEILRGDVNGDGSVNAADVTLLGRKLAGNDIVLSEGADYNDDGNVNSSDLTLLRRKLAGAVS